MSALLTSNTPPSIVLFKGALCRVEVGTEHLVEMDCHMVRHRLARVADWFADTAQGVRKPARPPLDVARDLLAWPDPPLPHVDEVVGVPVFASAGVLIDGAGLHAEERLILLPSIGLQVPKIAEHPTRADLERAKQLICEDLLGDFPFTSDSERVHALCAMLQPFLRRMIIGPCPLYLIEKPTPGSGGTLLAQVIAYPFLGHFPAAMTPPKEESEWRRTLYAYLAGESNVIFLDNIDGPLASSTLASVLTSEQLTDRVIRTSKTVAVPVRALFVASGNNPRLSRELLRRTVRIRLDPGVANPEMRTGFRHADLKAHIRASRGELVAAILTICRAWIDAGCPKGERTLGSFEAWSWTLGGVLDVVGLSGFLANREDFLSASGDGEGGLGRFLESWFEAHQVGRVGAGDLVEIADALDLGEAWDERGRKIRLGLFLQKHRDRACGRFTIRCVGDEAGSKLYRLEVTGQ